MTRTTLDLDPSVLAVLRKRKEQEHKTLGTLVSELLTYAFACQEIPTAPSASWVSKPMRAKVDLADKDALYAALGQQ